MTTHMGGRQGRQRARRPQTPAQAAPARLLDAARAAASHAHCPYSKYPVGAALLTADGAIFTGGNVENASYGLTVCAERVALLSAVAAGHRRFAALAVVAGGKDLAWPCGACRQVLADFCGPGLRVYVAPIRRLAAARTVRLGALLPRAFRL